MVARNEASNFSLGPSITRDSGLGSNQGWDGLVDSGEQGAFLNPSPLVVPQVVSPVVDDSDHNTMAKFRKSGTKVFVREIDSMKAKNLIDI